MDASIIRRPNSAALEFAALAASDPRVCLLVDAAGIVVSVNAAARHALPGLRPGTDFASVSPSPAAVTTYIRQCTRTRGPVPGRIVLGSGDGEPDSWSSHGGLFEPAAGGKAVVILRLQLAELGKSAFAMLNRKIETLNSEIEWRERADRTAGHLAAIVSSSTDAIYSKTLENIGTSWNQGAERIFGYTAQEMIGQSVLRLIPPDKRAEDAMLLGRLVSGETLEPVETVRQTKDGDLLDVSVTISPIKDGAGNIIGVSKIVRDIGARKVVERSLRAANASFRQLVDSSPCGVYAVDADFRLSQVSAGAQKAFENVRPLIGRDFAEALRIIWPEPAASEFIGRFRHTLETGEAYHAPTTVQTRHDTNQVEAYDWKIERMTLPDGRSGVVCHFYDLSERQHYEAALRESEQRFRGTFENVSVGVAHVGMDGRWLEINDRLCEIVGYTRAEILTQTLDRIRHPDDRGADLEHVRRLQGGEITSYQSEERYLRKDGGVVWVHVSVGLQRNNADAPAYLIYAVSDISERKSAQEHQQFLMGELAHRSKNQLAVIDSIAGQTARNAASIEDFRTVFAQRLNGLAVSIDLLVKGAWSGVPLRELIQQQLAPFKGDESRLHCEGPEVTLDGNAAEALGLALHELSTNSVKHGAWSAPGGTVSVSWNFDHQTKDTPRLRLSWVERGGPRVSKPTRRGFGQTLIQHIVAQKLQGEVDLAYPPEGLTWTLYFTVQPLR